MKQRYSFLVLFLFAAFSGSSQSVTPDVVASAGEFYSNSSGQIQWTLGEVAVETYQTTSNILTQGFHQPFVLGTAGIAANDRNQISIYPNPANEFVSVNFNSTPGKYLISLIDIRGLILQTEEISSSDFNIYTLSLKDYSNGMYFIKITGMSSNYNQSTRIIKAN